MKITQVRWLTGAAIAVAVGLFGLSSGAHAQTLFLNHFDSANNGINTGAGPADFSVGNPAQLSTPPDGPGGNIVPGGKFGNALSRPSGRVTYATAGNYNVNKGTIEMWVKGPGVTNSGFFGLWGTDTSSGNTDVRMYIYDTGAGRTLGAYQLNGGGSFWEIEQAIPPALLDNTNWHHVAWAFDTAAGVTATWWDGQLLRNTPDAGTVVPRTTYNNTRFHIGENQAGSASWPGSIDEFRISGDIVYDTNSSFIPPTAPFPPVPEPATLVLVAIGGGLLLGRRALRKSS